MSFPAHTAVRGISPEDQLGPLLGLRPPDELNGNFGAEECQAGTVWFLLSIDWAILTSAEGQGTHKFTKG